MDWFDHDHPEDEPDALEHTVDQDEQHKEPKPGYVNSLLVFANHYNQNFSAKLQLIVFRICNPKNASCWVKKMGYIHFGGSRETLEIA